MRLEHVVVMWNMPRDYYSNPEWILGKEIGVL
jgi:hypothetical protein